MLERAQALLETYWALGPVQNKNYAKFQVFF
jgi:hypothetical protein